KSILISLLFIVFIHYNEAQVKFGYPIPTNEEDLSCTINLCAKRGEHCSTENKTTGFECDIRDRCLDGICVEGLLENEVCQISADCDFGYSCVPSLNGKKYCEKAFFIDYGGACNKSIQCSHSLDCVNNVCSTPLLGCFSDLQCAEDEICTNGACQKYILQENECFIYRSLPCNKNFRSCILKSFNVSSIGICIDDVPEGSPCLTAKFSCQWGLGQYCSPLFVGSSLGKCSNPGSNKFNTCTTRRSCGENEYCKCDPTSGIGYCVILGTFLGNNCQDASKLYIECFLRSNCTQPYSANPFSCVRRNCMQESLCYESFCSEKLLPFDFCADSPCNLQLF
ncbi:hypothetical protein DICPUDRAFT_18421, partial [Dictyostelium purpureum]